MRACRAGIWLEQSREVLGADAGGAALATANKEQYAEILKIVLNYLDLEPLRMSHDDDEDVHQSVVESKA